MKGQFILLDNFQKIVSNRDMKLNKETWVGFVLTLLLAVLLLTLHGKSVHHQAGNHFTLTATFAKADGLTPTSEIRMAGIRIGQIGKQTLAPNGYQVMVELIFDKYYEIPTDSSISIETDGIMGAKHLEILPGGDEEMLENGDSFAYMQDALIFSELLDKVNAFMKEKKEKEASLKQVQEEVQEEQ